MKKLIVFFTTILMAVGADAVTLRICGENCDPNTISTLNQTLTDLGYLRRGSVAFDANSNKLTLNNVDILSDRNIIEIVQMEQLQIEVIGNCVLKTYKEGNEQADNALSCIYSTPWQSHPSNINFTGSGSLKMTSTNMAFFAFNRYSLLYEFNGPDVSIYARSGISSTSVYRVAYKMNAGSLDIWGENEAIFHYFNQQDGVSGTMTFGSGMKILEPNNAWWECKLSMGYGAYIQQLGESGNGVAKHVKIGSKYNLWIGNVQVTTQNCNDILGDTKVYYSQSQNTLTLDGATVSGPYQVIKSDIAGLHIKLLGENRLVTQHNSYGIALNESDGVVIEGDGSLSMESAVDQVGIGLFTHKTGSPAHVTIRDCSITMPQGYIQNEENDCALTLDHAYIHIRDGYISTPPELTLIDCKITNPVNGKVNEYGEVVTQHNISYWGDLEIVPTDFGLTVAGVEVLTRNCDHILGIGTDAATYNPSTKTLTLKSVNIIDDNISTGISVSNNDTLNIVLKGVNGFILSRGYGLSTNGITASSTVVNITGSGSLSLVADNGIRLFSGSKLALSGGGKVEIVGWYYGIVGHNFLQDMVHETVSVDGSTLKASVSTSVNANSAMWFIDDLTMTGCGITEPHRAYFDPEYMTIKGSDNQPVKSFTIAPMAALAEGDINGDNVVDVSDVNAIINIILEVKSPSDYPGNANLDGNNTIDISDMNALINIILAN